MIKSPSPEGAFSVDREKVAWEFNGLHNTKVALCQLIIGAG